MKKIFRKIKNAIMFIYRIPMLIRAGVKLYKNIKKQIMDANSNDLMIVMKEANSNILKVKDTLKTNQDVKNYYASYYERVKDKCESLDFFITICLADLQYNFIGGTIVNKGNDAIINIKP
jgi:hypothetical protein